MRESDYYYSTRRGWHGETDVVLCSEHTNSVKDVISSHRNAWNAQQRAAKLNREAYRKNRLSFY